METKHENTEYIINAQRATERYILDLTLKELKNNECSIENKKKDNLDIVRFRHSHINRIHKK